MDDILESKWQQQTKSVILIYMHLEKKIMHKKIAKIQITQLENQSCTSPAFSLTKADQNV